jgi:CRP-like cAMP-binding protein
VAGNFPKAPGRDIWQVLAPITSTREFGEGDQLFQHGHKAQGIYIIERGQVKLLLSCKPRATKPFELVGPGAVLGLCEAVSGAEYRVTAEAAGSLVVSYIEGQDLVSFLRDNCEVCMEIVHLLSEDLHALYYKFRRVAGTSPRGRRKGSRRVN